MDIRDSKVASGGSIKVPPDERPAPDGWHHVLWPDEAIDLVKTGEVVEIDLDHELGDEDRGTGYDIILWIGEAVATGGFTPPGDSDSPDMGQFRP